jgi:hypothetical protein
MKEKGMKKIENKEEMRVEATIYYLCCRVVKSSSITMVFAPIHTQEHTHPQENLEVEHTHKGTHRKT